MKTINLTKGMVALVDDEDYEYLTHWNWQVMCCKGYYYAMRNENVSGHHKTILMHRVIVGAISGQLVDHKDHCTLNNQRRNLRKADKSKNAGNSIMDKRNTSGRKGVYWNRKTNKWIAQICLNGNRKYIGSFESIDLAARAYDMMAKSHWGPFALTNGDLVERQ